MWRFFGALSLIAVAAGAPGPAAATLSICNQSGELMNVALAYEGRRGLRSEGWWAIGANQCADVIVGRLPARVFYLYAKDAFGRSALEGGVEICVAMEQFRTVGPVDCAAAGMVAVPFAAVDVGDAASWTVVIARQGAF